MVLDVNSAHRALNWLGDKGMTLRYYPSDGML